ncbi:MAG: DUF1566 domain-containing protein [Paludibacter sp.]|nr:DUF1566 domain-containing protein [Paludibacter sp.]
MKKLFLFSIAIICINAVFGQTVNKQKVAVYVTGEDSTNIVLADQLGNAIVRSGKYTLIERADEFLNSIYKEIQFQDPKNGNVDDNEIVQRGKQFGASIVCIASIIDFANSKYMFAKLIDVKTLEVKNTDYVLCSFGSAEETLNAMNILAKKITITIKDKQETGYQELPLANIAVQTLDITNSSISFIDAQNLCKNSTVGGYTDWRLPTLDELTKIFHNKKEFDNLKGNYYSIVYNMSIDNEDYYDVAIFNMEQGTMKHPIYDQDNYKCSCRCVRSLESGMFQNASKIHLLRYSIKCSSIP